MIVQLKVAGKVRYRVGNQAHDLVAVVVNAFTQAGANAADDAKFFHELARQALLRGFVHFEFSTRKLPQPREVFALLAPRSKYAAFLLDKGGGDRDQGQSPGLAVETGDGRSHDVA